jgi:hypothetical protein
MPTDRMEHSVQEAAAAFARQIGGLSQEPEIRDGLLKTGVRDVAWQLLGEFRDPCRLAEQLAIASRLVWLRSRAFQAAGSAGPRSDYLGAAHGRAALEP